MDLAIPAVLIETLDHKKGIAMSRGPTNPNAGHLGPIDIEVHDATGVLRLTPNDIVMKHIQGATYAPSPTYPSELSGVPGVLYRTTQVDLYLSPEELDRLVRLDLKPEEALALIERHGDMVHELHDDFYDPDTGETLQPREF